MRLRILLSAYYCSPYRGGEAAVGWRFATGLAQYHDVTVLCGDLSAEAPMAADLERYRCEKGLPPGLTIHHVQACRLTRKIYDAHALPGLWFLYYESYRRWQQQALELAERLHAEQPFDLAHHLTVIGFREPGYLWQIKIPFVWGPINGAAVMPWRFIKGFGGAGAYRHLTRNVMNILQIHLPSRSRRAARAAVKIWAVTREDQQMVQELWCCRSDLMIETGATPCETAPVKSLNPGEPLVLVWCGIIEVRKALHLLLGALAGMPAEFPWELHVIGDGPRRKHCQMLAERAGIAGRIRWVGNVDHAEAQKLMDAGHTLVHSSLKEGTPHVVLEAMARALPVVCHDACGMGVAVNASCGIKVPLLNPETSIHGFRNAIARLATEPGLLATLSAGAKARAQALSWQTKIAEVAKVYLQIAG